MTILYFAYGSNMFTPRLRFRMNACQPVGTATLAGHELRFHKRSKKDGSAKCNALAVVDLTARVHGVLFELPEANLDELHRVEGRGYGYDDRQVAVTRPDGTTVGALTYLATADAIDDHLRPFGWYWDFVAHGAAEHGLPTDYVQRFIASVRPDADPDKRRDAEERGKVTGDEHDNA